MNAMQFTIPFKASDPVIYNSFEQESVGSGVIYNAGTLECPLVITITGIVTDPTVVVGNYSLSYSGTLAEADVLVIDTGALTCTLNGVNALTNLTGLSPDIKLQPGKTFVIATDGGIAAFRYRERWL